MLVEYSLIDLTLLDFSFNIKLTLKTFEFVVFYHYGLAAVTFCTIWLNASSEYYYKSLTEFSILVINLITINYEVSPTTSLNVFFLIYSLRSFIKVFPIQLFQKYFTIHHWYRYRTKVHIHCIPLLSLCDLLLLQLY